MKKLKYYFHYSKKSLIIRCVLALLVIVAIGLVAGLREPISQKMYGWSNEQVSDAESEVHFIDVGQGDSTLIRFKGGKTMLIDCGPRSSAGKLCSYISNLGVQKIDYFLLTHPDEDHIGGGVEIFANFEVKDFYRPMFYSKSEENLNGYPVHDTDIYDEVIAAFHAEQGAIMHYNSVDLSMPSGDGYEVKILYPSSVQSNANASSAVLQVKLDKFKFLFMGDAETKQESVICDEYGNNLKSDVLKVGHHGAKNATSDKLLSFVQPDYGVISCGKNNSYGHPTSQVLNALNSHKVNIYRTDEQGSVVFAVKGGVLHISGRGKMIDYALIISLLSLAILIIFGIPDIKKPKQNQKNSQIDLVK